MVTQKLLCLFSLLTLFLVGNAFAQNNASESELKTAFIYNFIRYTEWPSERTRRTPLKVVYLGDDNEYWQVLKQIQERKVRKLSLEIRNARNINDILPTDILIVDPALNSKLKTVVEKIAEKAILLITEGYTEQSKIGINFVFNTDETLSFEINRYNLIYNRLKVDPDIVILGGTEIEIATLVKDIDSELETSRTQLHNQTIELSRVQQQVQAKQKQLNQQSIVLENQQKSLNSLDASIDEYKSKYDTLQQEYADMQSLLQTSRDELNNNNQLLEVKQAELQKRTIDINEMSDLINHNRQLLLSQTAEIDQQKRELTDFQAQVMQQSASLQAQSATIKTQSVAIYISVVLIFAVVVIITLIYRSAKLKQKTNQELEHKNNELKTINQKLSTTQKQLVESEKMAALGGLVAGVAHEINTPIGVSVTSVSHMMDTIKVFKEDYAAGNIKRSQLETLVDNLDESSDILSRNLTRASELIRSFKQVSVDQTYEERRPFEIRSYLKEVIQNLQHKIKQKQHTVNIDCDDTLSFYSYPGIFAQVFTNLIVNSLVHGFSDKDKGEMVIQVKAEASRISIDYYDNGKGIPDKVRPNIFNPFFTTNRSAGGTGLGLHICYNLVTQKMGGDIECLPHEQGAHFHLDFPADEPTG